MFSSVGEDAEMSYYAGIDQEMDEERFLQRPVLPETVDGMRAMCTDAFCRKIECLAVKALLSYIEDRES